MIYYSMLICFFLGLGTVHAQKKTAKDYRKDVAYKKFIERINGQWKLEHIVDAAQQSEGKENRNDEPGTRNQNPAAANENQGNNAMQMIEFMDDARYRMNNATTAIDSGSYRLNEQHGILYLESDKDPTPSEWKISLNKDQLSLTGRGQDATSRYRYVYTRIKEKAAK
jgi:hypothetical protein